jgi:hypothetical protein
MGYTKYNYKNLKKDFSYKKLYEEIVKNNKTYRELQDEYIYNERLFSKLAKEYNIPKNYQNIRRNAIQYHVKNFDLEEIIYLYKEEFLSLRAIGTIFECEHGVIRNILVKNNIEIRPFNDKHYYINRSKSFETRCLDSGGYVIVNGKRKHRIVMEQYLGRELLPKEQVHHIDMNKQNNSLSNLFLFCNSNFHNLYHGYIRRNKYIAPDMFMQEYEKFYESTIFNYDWLYNQYIVLNKSIKSISEEMEISRICISNSLKKLDIYRLREPIVNQFI